MKNTLRMTFVDEGTNEVKINISDVKNDVNLAEVTPFSEYVIANKMVKGKVGVLASFKGAKVVTVEERAL